MNEAEIRERLLDLAAAAPEGFPAPPQLLRRARRRIALTVASSVAISLAVVAGGIAGVRWLDESDTRPADQTPTGFVGAWASIDYNDHGTDTASHQTMTIRAGEEGVLQITVHENSSVCSETPTTTTGTGRLEEPTTLVVPSPVLACDDGSDPDISAVQEEGLSNYTLVLDLATDRLYDSLGVVWTRGAPPGFRGAESTEAGADGPGTFSMLYGEVTFRTPGPWTDHAEAYLDPRLFFLTGPRGEPEGVWIEILVNPLPPDAPCDSLRVPSSAEELVQAVRSNPDLDATVPVTERVGGIDALRMDVVAAPGASIAPCGGDRVPVVSVPGRGAWGGVEPGGLGRLYVLDLPGGSARTLAICITAPEPALFEQAVETAVPVLDSFEFHTGVTGTTGRLAGSTEGEAG